jgi:two-component system cell cycle sensor histidine kinase/response regulator CckA
MSNRRRLALVTTLQGKITLLFVIIATLVPGLLAFNWTVWLQPRLKGEASSSAIALAHSQASSLAFALSPPTGEIQQSDVMKAIDDILLLLDPNTNNRFINRVAIELDYDVVRVKKGSLDIAKGEKECTGCFVTEIPLYSRTTKELVGIATFHVSGEGFQRLQHEVMVHLLTGTGGAMLLIILSWWVVVVLLRPLNTIFAATKGLREGEYPQVPLVETSDDLGRLSTEFNNMSQAIKDREDKLLYSQRRIRELFERVEHAIFKLDPDFKVIESNRMFELLCDRDADFFCLIPEEKRDPLLKRAIDGKLIGEEIVIAARDGKDHSISLSVYPEIDEQGAISGFDCHFVDMTERKKLEEALLQTQKLESLGLLAGGIAHDFNNILTIIIGYSELAIMKLAGDAPLQAQMKAIHEQGAKAAALTRQLLAFSRKQVMELKIINLNTIIRNMAKMLGRLIGETIEMKLLLQHAVGNIKADPGQIEQIIMNLAINAKDAMPDGGRLVFETDTIALDEEYCRAHVGLAPGSYVLLAVTDSGLGMTPEVKEKIFDPFFTTKAKGAGTGLGLSTVYGIIKQLKGHIFVYSERGHGTSFKIYFPVIQEAEEKMDDEGLRLPEAAPPGTETILVVDDEASIRYLVCDTLQSLGYTMIEAADGEAALAICKTAGLTIDLLLTDVIMPGMGGKELADAVRAIQPDVKVLFMSGYTDEVIAHQGVLEPGRLFINKPLMPSILTRKIRKILDSR